jgi:hypothetical protein
MPHSTTFAEAVAGYDREHEIALMKVIITAVFEASILEDESICALRTGEITNALVTTLASVLAMSPSATRSPAAIRKTLDSLEKQLRRKVANAEQDEFLQELHRRRFRNPEGSA